MEYRDNTVETANVTLEQNKSNFRASSIVTLYTYIVIHLRNIRIYIERDSS